MGLKLLMHSDAISSSSTTSDSDSDSDETQRVTILRGAQGRLERSPHSALRRVRCEVREGVLWLGGYLPSSFLKQMAQAEVSGLAGVRTIVNEITVLTPRGGEAAVRFASET